VEAQANLPTVRVHFDRAQLARFGLRAGAAAEAMRTAFVGREVGQVFEGQVAFPLVVRYPAEVQHDLQSIRLTKIDTPSGARVPLGSVAAIRDERGPNFISRENGRRKIVVSANVSGRDLRSVVDGIREAVSSDVVLPTGYAIEYGGQFESEAAASRRLSWLGLTVVLGILVLLGVMLKDASRYEKTGGWGYEAWAGDSRSERLVKDGGTACYECHTSEQGSDYVFSRWRD